MDIQMGMQAMVLQQMATPTVLLPMDLPRSLETRHPRLSMLGHPAWIPRLIILDISILEALSVSLQ